MPANKSLKISIAMCTYNGENFIREQLNSFVSQSRLPDELIICDDRSTDNTINIIRDFIKTAPFNVQLIINEKQLGSTKNFEKAILHCKGDIIFLSDQDDIWEKNKVALIEDKFIQNKKVGMVFTNAAMVDQSLNDLGYSLWETIPFSEKEQTYFPNQPIEVLIRKNIVTGATMAFRSIYTEMMIPFSENWIHDAWIAVLIGAKEGTLIEIIDQPLIKYRQHSNNQLGAVKKNLSEQISVAKSMSVMLNIQFKDIEDILIQKKVNIKDHVLKMIQQKQKHVELRNNLSPSMIKRILQVGKEASSLNYNKYSNGFKTILKDIFLK